jgi:hypothetical protein
MLAFADNSCLLFFFFGPAKMERTAQFGFLWWEKCMMSRQERITTASVMFTTFLQVGKRSSRNYGFFFFDLEHSLSHTLSFSKSIKGRDSTVCFVTGAFNVEEAKKGLDTLAINQLGGIESWRDFYANDDKYPFVGLLIDPRYYDEAGTPAPALDDYRTRLQTAMNLDKEKAAAKKK